MLKTNDSIKQLCESLNRENQKYALAVAQALAFTQQNQKKVPCKSSSPRKPPIDRPA